tara:strand:+ start:684 stop:1358 length:675 start_codon:yes stop_codon:yes gene_type:complete
MLKPKKRITKKEIQRDPLLDTIDQLQTNLEDNKSLYSKILFGAIGLIILVIIMIGKRSQNNVEAETALGQALVSIDKSDLVTADFQLENIINDYNSSASSDKAMFYLGKRKYDNGDFESAKNYLEDFLDSKSDNLLTYPAVKILGEIYFKMDDMDNALNIINKGLKNCDDSYNCRSLRLQKANLLIYNDKQDDAELILEELKDLEKIDAGQKQQLEELLGKLVG